LCQHTQLAHLEIFAVFAQDAFAIYHKQREGSTPQPKISLEQATLDAPSRQGNPHLVFLLPTTFEGIHQPCQGDGSGALLVVVQMGSRLSHAGCPGCGSTLAVRGLPGLTPPQPGCRLSTRLMIASGSLVPTITATPSMRPGTCRAVLCLHDRHASLGADIAQAEHARAIADHRYGIPLVRIVVNKFWIRLNRPARGSDARCVPDGEILNCARNT